MEQPLQLRSGIRNFRLRGIGLILHGLGRIDSR